MMYGQQQQQVHQFQKQTKMDPHHVSRTVGGVGDNRTKPTEEGEERRMRRRLDDVIDLSGMSLDSLPNTRINLAAITELDLSNNDLQVIPESLMARLLNLIVLDVHSNQLKCLPNSIGCLSKLKLLNVSGNLLEYLPKTIEHCRSLEEMNANFNKLKRLPETIGFELINLKKLSINSNRIGLLPQSISHLTALRVLDARLNCLRYMPDDLENLINLQVLNISQNFQHLETLPYSVGLLLSLVELDVSYNTITALPNSLGCLHKLQKLSLEGNPLVSPPPEVVERGLKATKIYLSEKMNSDDHQSPKKNSWVGKWVRYGTLNGSTIRNIISRSDDDQERDRFITSDFGEIDSLAVPRRQPGMFSPRRLFSSQCYSAKS